ncbi:hypothetical protein D3C75_1143570 [compost metagenome]
MGIRILNFYEQAVIQIMHMDQDITLLIKGLPAGFNCIVQGIAENDADHRSVQLKLRRNVQL